jgi:hypothetical protein
MNAKQRQDSAKDDKIRRFGLEAEQTELHVQASAQAPDAGLMRKLATNPKTLAPGQVLQLQRLVGNRTVQRLFAPQRRVPAARVSLTRAAPQVQMLRVDAADTKFEEEADRISEAVVQGKHLNVQGKHLSVQRSPGSVGAEGGELDAGLERQIKGATGGTALPGAVRGVLEPKLGVDLKNVKAHTGVKSAQLNRQLNAKAFTYKNNIFYGKGQSPSDLSLTSHEVTHTIHQGAVPQRARQDDEA